MTGIFNKPFFYFFIQDLTFDLETATYNYKHTNYTHSHASPRGSYKFVDSAQGSSPRSDSDRAFLNSICNLKALAWSLLAVGHNVLWEGQLLESEWVTGSDSLEAALPGSARCSGIKLFPTRRVLAQRWCRRNWRGRVTRPTGEEKQINTFDGKQRRALAMTCAVAFSPSLAWRERCCKLSRAIIPPAALRPTCAGAFHALCTSSATNFYVRVNGGTGAQKPLVSNKQAA